MDQSLQRRLACFHGEYFSAASQWAQQLSEVGITGGAEWTALQVGEIQSQSGFGAVRRVTLSDGSRVYFKAERYSLLRRLKGWLRPMRTTIEAFAYEQLQRLGIATLTTVALGERRLFGLPVASCIATLEVPDSRDLRAFSLHDWRYFEEPYKSEIYQLLAGQLAEQLRLAHKHGFVHHDLKWRNILVQQNGEALQLIWIDAPRAAIWQMRRRRGRVVDLSDVASLAVLLVSKYDRMRFILRYLGGQRRPGEAAALCRLIDRRLARRRSRQHELG